jgi:hypothetical protein
MIQLRRALRLGATHRVHDASAARQVKTQSAVGTRFGGLSLVFLREAAAGRSTSPTHRLEIRKRKAKVFHVDKFFGMRRGKEAERSP